MSQHSSLKAGAGGRKHRSVLKKYERIEKLSEKEEWDESKSVYGLPKVKMVKFKIKKDKAVEEAVEEGAEGAVPSAAEGAVPPTAEGAVPPAKPEAKEKKPEGKK